MNPAGVIYALLAYGTWGVVPVYWKALGSVPALEVVAHRVVGTLLFTMLLLWVLGRSSEARDALRKPRDRWALLASGALIGTNWAIFIWAVNHDQLLEASFGYYLNPLVNVVLGTLLLGERLLPLQGAAVGLAALAVAGLAIPLGGLPWVSLSLAGSFALYGLIHKLCPVRSIPGLAIETGMLAPAALGLLLLWIQPAGGALVTGHGEVPVLLAAAGPVTAFPLLWFASAARRLPLSTLGLFQYIAPSLSFVLAVAVYGEPFTRVHALAFGCIWLALGLYTFDGWRRRPPPLAG